MSDVAPLEPWETDDWQWYVDLRPVLSEADWLACPYPGALIDYVNQSKQIGRRKFFLAGAACVRRIWHLLNGAESRAAVEAAERYADGEISQEELLAIQKPASDFHRRWHEGDPRFMAAIAASRLSHDLRQNQGLAEHTMYAPVDASKAVALLNGVSEGSEVWYAKEQAEMRVQAEIYRCVMGNPFRPMELKPMWQTPKIIHLGSAIYADRAFERLPLLADALEEAGCTNADMLVHCRSKGPHARGCWVIDLLLGREAMS